LAEGSRQVDLGDRVREAYTRIYLAHIGTALGGGQGERRVAELIEGRISIFESDPKKFVEAVVPRTAPFD